MHIWAVLFNMTSLVIPSLVISNDAGLYTSGAKNAPVRGGAIDEQSEITFSAAFYDDRGSFRIEFLVDEFHDLNVDQAT